MSQVWVVETWEAHGYSHYIQGVYESREAAFEGLKDEPNMTVYVDDHGLLQGKPKRERGFGDCWAGGRPHEVKGRKVIEVPDLPKGAPFRHVRQQATMLLSGADEATLRATVLELIFLRPDLVLTALANVIEKREGF